MKNEQEELARHTFRRRIRERRQKLGISIEAANLNTFCSIHKLESGQTFPNLEELARIASFYCESVDYFLGIHDIESDVEPELNA